jgi:hypothetical protein
MLTEPEEESMEETVNACLLDRTEQTKRLDEIAALASRSLVGAERTEGGALLRLRSTETVQTELCRLIDAESKCCPFLYFEMRVADDEVQLDVSGPPDARSLIDQLFRLRTAHA